MTKTFERFLRSFSDEQLASFAQERGRIRPPYWRALQVALRIESDRRGLRYEADVPGSASGSSLEQEARRGSA
jgi:hypothetical protein